MPSEPKRIDEAYQSWCPFFRKTGPLDSAGTFASNRPAGMRDHYCVGPECMAWQPMHPAALGRGKDDDNEYGRCLLIPGDK